MSFCRLYRIRTVDPEAWGEAKESGVNSKGTVLLIEDEEAIADLVRMYFEQEGFRLVHAPDGERGIDAVFEALVAIK